MTDPLAGDPVARRLGLVDENGAPLCRCLAGSPECPHRPRRHPVHDNYYAKRDGTPYAAPLANRGPEALQHLLADRLDLVAEQLHLLDRTELVALAQAAEHLARMSRGVVAEFWPGHVEAKVAGWSEATCDACGREIRVWDGPGQRRVLLDPEPTDEGSTIIQADGTPIGVIREDVVGRYTLYRAHFFTCPNRLIVAGPQPTG